MVNGSPCFEGDSGELSLKFSSRAMNGHLSQAGKGFGHSRVMLEHSYPHSPTVLGRAWAC